MGDDILIDFGPVEDKMQGIIKVIGVGGGGCNAVRNMNDEHIPGVTFAVCNTDSKSLAPSRFYWARDLVLEANPKSGARRRRRILRI